MYDQVVNNFYPARSYDCTVPITIAREKFYVRYSLLQTCGSYFSHALVTFRQNGEIIFPDNVCSRPEALSHVLTYLDTGFIPYNKELWCEYLKIGEFFERPDLIKIVIEYIGPDFIGVINTSTFLSLSPQLVTQLLQYDGLKINSEIDVFGAGGRWIIANKKSACLPVGDEIINSVRWPYLPSCIIQMCYTMGEMDLFARPSTKRYIMYYKWWREMYENGHAEILSYPFPASRWYYDAHYVPDIGVLEILAKKFEMIDLEEPFIETFDKPRITRRTMTDVWRSLVSKKNSIKSSLSRDSISDRSNREAKSPLSTFLLVRGSILSLIEKFKSPSKILSKSLCMKCNGINCVCYTETKPKVELRKKEYHKALANIETLHIMSSKDHKKSPSLIKRLSNLKIKLSSSPDQATSPKVISPIKEHEEIINKQSHVTIAVPKADNVGQSSKKSRRSRKYVDKSMKERGQRRKSSVRPLEPLEPDKTLADAPPRAEVHFDAPLIEFLPGPLANDIKLNAIYLMGSYQISSEEERQTEACSTCWKMFYTQGWTPIQPMPESKISHTVCAMYGEVYVIGGIDLTNQISDEVLAYTEVCDAWRSITRLAEPKYACGAAEFQRQIFVTGGIGYNIDGMPCILASVEVYNPFEKIWTQAKPLPKPICYHGLIESNGSLYHIGGASGKSPSDLTPCGDVYKYDIEYDIWIQYKTLKIPRYKFATMTVGKYLFVINGVTQGNKLTNSIEKYNTEREDWETETFSKQAMAIDPICASIRGQIKAEVWDIPWDHLRLEWNNLTLEDKILGQGHFGLVKKGVYHHDDSEIPTAVKMLKAAGAGNDPLAEQGAFIETVRELTIMSKLPINTNIVNTIGAIINQGMLYICTEFCNNGDLKSFLNKVKQYQAQCSSNDLLKLAVGIAKGCLTSLTMGDLAARNILLGDNNTPKVCDFGLARDHGLYVRMKYGTKNLPIKWLAPECLTQNRYTEKSDIWAFGVLLWELVTNGESPYPNMTNMEVKDKVISGYRMDKPYNCTDEMFEVMKSCWKANAIERPTFSELALTLEELYIAKTAGETVANKEEVVPSHSWGSGHLWKTLKDLTHKI